MRIFAHRLELYIMAKWYEKYLSIYGKSFKEIPDEVLDQIKHQLAMLQSSDPLVSVVVIAYNEEKRLSACLWSLSELQTKYPIEKSDLKKFISYFCDNKRMEDVGDEMLNFDYEEFYKSEEKDIQNLEINKSQDEEK